MSAASISGNINPTMTSLRSRFVPLVARALALALGACDVEANDLDCCAGSSCKQGKCKP